MRQAIVPDALKDAAAATGVSPAIRAGGCFLTGATGSAPEGTMPQAASDQARNALRKVCDILSAAGATEADVVEMTSYHTDIAASFADVQKELEKVFFTPLPARTAVEVAGLRRPGAHVEFRIIARDPQAGTP